MRRIAGILSCAMTSLLVLVSCSTYGPYVVTAWNPYGARLAAPGQRLQEFHAGVDFDVHGGTPVIAVADGEVIRITKAATQAPWDGGYFVRVSHGARFDSYYGHLDEVHVQQGQSLKRGALIGLSGGNNAGRHFLHLGICKKEGNCLTFSRTEVHTYDPGQYWLGGKPQCFDPRTNYSGSSQGEITVPLACGDYTKDVIARVTGKDRK